jgi:limonene-1,2-epoxide hydrolase
MDHEKSLKDFLGEWGKDFDTIIAAFRKYLAVDAAWEQHPFATTRSVDEAIALLHLFREKAGLVSFPADIRQIAVNGDVAFVERVDHLRRSDGSLILSIPITGAFEFNRRGQIAAWREYMDPGPALQLLGKGP